MGSKLAVTGGQCISKMDDEGIDIFVPPEIKLGVLGRVTQVCSDEVPMRGFHSIYLRSCRELCFY
jgi:hypothetical protein